MVVFVYSDKYLLDWPGHVFPVDKYRFVHERIIASGIAGPERIKEPSPATRAELERVHTAAYLDELERLARQGVAMDAQVEAPLNEATLSAFKLAAGGTILACRLALSGHGATMNLTGGFHHAYADHGEGFCFVNDVAVGVAAMLAEGMAAKVMVVDCDVHQGNGTARTFAGDQRVFTLDVHQEHLYPIPKEAASLNIGLPIGTTDDRYLQLLAGALDTHVAAFGPDLMVYLAGGDPYMKDRLGSLRLTKKGFAERDRMVIEVARDNGVALAVVLAGGYPEDIYDVVDIHFQTAKLLSELCG
jgi:acetoin utilization deacetylase AcuC-like enzyme